MKTSVPGSEFDAVWRPPAELEGVRPREVRLTPAGRILSVLAVLLAVGSVAAGVLLHIKAVSDREFLTQLAEVGHESEGRVLRCWKSSGKDARYWVEYTFQARDSLHRARIQIGRRNWEALRPGSALQVRYLPQDPSRHAVRGHEGKPMPLAIPYAVAGAMAISAWLITLAPRNQRRLLAEGRPAQAIVTRHEKTKDGVAVHYEFRVLSGARASGKAQQGKKPAPLGSTLCVIYEPDRVRHNAIYPLSLVRTRRDRPR
jgi:hypothetical protein